VAAAGLLLALVAPAPAAAVSSQTWRQRERAEFEKGEPKGVALGADGALRLSPRLDVLFESSQPYIWALAQDAKGVVYAAGGNDGAVERVSASGRPEVVFRAPEPEVHALAVDASGHLYLGTAPGGAIYKIDEKGRTIWRCETGEEYVWALLFDRQGVLHAGTGPEGRILKVDGQGRAEVLFDSAETHIRTLALDRDGRLLAGTDGHGLLFRISPKGEGFVLYDAPLNEIAALAVSPEGTIYAAVLGETGRGVPRAGPPPAAPAQAAPTPAPGADAAPQPSPTPAPEQAPPISEQRVPISMEGKLLAISPEGYAREIWSGAQEAILSLAFTASGRLILGSSQKGRIYALDSGGEISEIARAPSTQVTALLPLVRPVAGQAAAEARKGRKGGAGAAPGDVAAAGSNFGSLSVLRAGHVASGSFESRVFDARSFATWGRLSWRAEMPRGTSVAVSARSGNTEEPDRTWSDWGPALGEPGGSALDRPPARFLQWRAVLTTEDPGRTPVLREVAVTYLQRNLPPEIRKVEVHPPGVAFQKVPASASAGAPEARPSGSAGAEVEGGARRRAKPQSRRGFEAGFRSVTWQAADANDDDLVFDVHYRAVDETTWKPMRSAIDEDFVSWDGAAMPDGTYVVRVIASDAPSNAPGLALTAERVSEQFDVDTTPPRVEDLRVQAGSASLRLSFTVTDTFSIVRDVACSVDAGDWVVLFPADGLADAPSERFDAVLPALPPGEHSIVVRATDSAGNTGAGRVLVTIP
jgi:sugar lactone lactonase YvrE